MDLLKKFLSSVLIFTMLIIPVSADTGAKISINADNTSPNVGEVIKVTISMTDFLDLSILMPSIHFNPEVLKLCDKDGNILTSRERDMSFF